MEKLSMVRDAVFWWIGCWAMFTGLDAAVVLAVVKHMERCRAKEDKEFACELADLLRRQRGVFPPTKTTVPIPDEDGEPEDEEGKSDGAEA